MVFWRNPFCDPTILSNFNFNWSLRGYFSLTVTAQVEGMIVSQTTNMMDITTLDAAMLQAELEALTNLGGSASELWNANCEYKVTFYFMNANLSRVLISK